MSQDVAQTQFERLSQAACKKKDKEIMICENSFSKGVSDK